MIGENPTKANPFGSRGNALIRHHNESYENVALMAGFSKAFSSHCCWIKLPSEIRTAISVAATPHIYSGMPQ